MHRRGAEDGQATGTLAPDVRTRLGLRERQACDVTQQLQRIDAVNVLVAVDVCRGDAGVSAAGGSHVRQKGDEALYVERVNRINVGVAVEVARDARDR
jgi:hypothetical protein